MQNVKDTSYFITSDIEEIDEESEVLMASNNRSCSKESTSPPHQCTRSFKHHVHFERAKRKISAPAGGEPMSISRGGATNTNNHSPGGFAADLLEWFRPKAFSDNHSSKGRRRSSGDASSSSTQSNVSRPSTTSTKRSDEGFHSSEDVTLPLFVDTKMANAWVNSIPQDCLYQRSMSITSDPFSCSRSYQRPRSNSEFGRYWIMRKSRDPDGINEFVGTLDLEENGEFAYCQLLATMKCYDLMPQFSKMVVFDSRLPVRKAFVSLVNNWVRAAVILNPSSTTICGVLTVSDFMTMLLDISAKKLNENIVDQPLSVGLGFDTETCKRPKPVVVKADLNLLDVAKILCSRRIHRVVVVDSEINGDPLYLLSKKTILKSLHKLISRITLPRCMYTPIDELQNHLGTWQNIATVKLTTTLHKALLKFVGKGVSCLPVLNENRTVVDILTKADILNLIVDEGPSESYLTKTVQEAILLRKEGVEKMVNCNKKTSLMLAVECLLHTEAHRLVVVDSNGSLNGIISVSDFMRFLLGSSS